MLTLRSYCSSPHPSRRAPFASASRLVVSECRTISGRCGSRGSCGRRWNMLEKRIGSGNNSTCGSSRSSSSCSSTFGSNKSHGSCGRFWFPSEYSTPTTATTTRRISFSTSTITSASASLSASVVSTDDHVMEDDMHSNGNGHDNGHGMRHAHAVSSSLINSTTAKDAAVSSTATDSATIASFLFDFQPHQAIRDIQKASKYNQGSDRWTPSFCRAASLNYVKHLQYIVEYQQQQQQRQQQNDEATTDPLDNEFHVMDKSNTEEEIVGMVSPDIVCCALKALIRCQYDTPVLAQKVRTLEQCIGSIGHTPLTNELSLHLLQANGLAGHVGRSLALLELRKSRGYEPYTKTTVMTTTNNNLTNNNTPTTTTTSTVCYDEFEWAIQSIVSASLEYRRGRNIYKGEREVHSHSAAFALLDNPTRFLDAILLNMHHRQVPLTSDIVTKLLNTYAATGRTGKAIHFHYRVISTKTTDKNPFSSSSSSTTTSIPERKRLVRVQWNPPPPYYKVPSEIKSSDSLVAMPGNTIRRTKLQHEMQEEWSTSLTAAFAFADSITHGACGHDPMELTIDNYNALIKACCYRGALWRAMEILHTTIPQQQKQQQNDTLQSNVIQPNAQSYLKILEALARVGDVVTMQRMFDEMVNLRPSRSTNHHIMINKNSPLSRKSNENDFLIRLDSGPVGPLIVRAMVDGMLNVSNVAGAITFIQTTLNQYAVLPPYTTHLKVLELALATDLIYEAKRHVYFIQSIWRWDSNNPYHSNFISRQVKETQRNPKLSKEALQDLFQYFGYTLEETDFFPEFRHDNKKE